jgi:hypothetical protein
MLIRTIKIKKMEYRKLGKTDLALSAITYGAFAIGGNMWGGNEKKILLNPSKRLSIMVSPP